eukprot:CAMPEP_0117496866 /NCGR_PEP_ID=MMETSP0784-20121206/20880_1 /TAXON_ID=39447 /ORGANISM="" /LENGTH=60 /DNA_ID=CAMNT_0005291855 /DNA_START=859 /DNA_END=1041 /DNA_ORIENTATION=-
MALIKVVLPDGTLSKDLGQSARIVAIFGVHPRAANMEAANFGLLAVAVVVVAGALLARFG